jgi:manganese/zinc/iron transport system permease protein
MISYTFFVVLVGTTFFSVAASILGIFVSLRRYSLLADAVSHAVLPGTVLALIITGSSHPVWLMIGGMVSGAVGAFLVVYAHQVTRLKTDTLLGVVLSSFFGLGLVCLSYVQKYNMVGQGALTKFLFGNPALMVVADVYQIIFVVIVVLSCVYIFFNRLIFVLFDRHYAMVLGYSPLCIDYFIIGLLLILIATGLQVIGVILMSTMIIAPGVAARQWTAHMPYIIVLSALFGGTGACVGTVLSSMVVRLSTGPVIAIILIVWTFFSMIAARFFYTTKEQSCGDK